MELSLDLSLTFVPRTIYELLIGEVYNSQTKDGSQKRTMLEDFVKRLEDEMWKIEAFKRELPLCMILVNDVATPKQIRELMQVEDLTNDEVKSHLQKYRLRFRRIPVCPRIQANGGTQDQCGENKLKGTVSQSGSPQGPLFLGLGGYVKGLSSSGRNSMDTEEDVQSDCHRWKGGFH